MLFISRILLVALATQALAATQYRKFTSDEASVPMLTITPDPTKAITLAEGTAKATYCNTPYTIGVARYGTGNSHTVTQYCFTNQSGASLSIMPQ